MSRSRLLVEMEVVNQQAKINPPAAVRADTEKTPFAASGSEKASEKASRGQRSLRFSQESSRTRDMPLETQHNRRRARLSPEPRRARLSGTEKSKDIPRTFPHSGEKKAISRTYLHTGKKETVITRILPHQAADRFNANIYIRGFRKGRTCSPQNVVWSSKSGEM